MATKPAGFKFITEILCSHLGHLNNRVVIKTRELDRDRKFHSDPWTVIPPDITHCRNYMPNPEPKRNFSGVMVGDKVTAETHRANRLQDAENASPSGSARTGPRYRRRGQARIATGPVRADTVLLFDFNHWPTVFFRCFLECMERMLYTVGRNAFPCGKIRMSLPVILTLRSVQCGSPAYRKAR